MRARQIPHNVSLPSLNRHYWYYARLVPGAEYPLYCRRPYDKEKNVNVNFENEVAELFQRDPLAALPFYSDEVIFLDVNLFAKEQNLKFVDMGSFAISPDERSVAAMMDCSNGREVFTCFIVEIGGTVNFAQWLQRSASPAERSWASQMEAAGKSIYEELNQKNFSTHYSESPQSSKPNTPVTLSPSVGSPCSEIRKTPTDQGGDWQQSAKRPSHNIRYKLDLFDMSDDVFWLSNDTLLYFALDTKMRPFQLVCHDLTVEAQNEPQSESPADPTLICYEETDEKFWLSSLSFTADDAFLLFSSSSTDVSEWFVIPTSVFTNPLSEERPVTECIPVVRHEEGEVVSLDTCRERKQMLPFLKRMTEPFDRDYDVDHHRSILRAPSVTTSSPSDGAWIITSDYASSSPDTKLKNMAVFLAPDERINYHLFNSESLTDKALLPDDTALVPLFAYDPLVKVDDVDMNEHFLLLSVRKNGSPTSLFCSTETVRRWWSETQGREPIPLSALTDLSLVLRSALSSDEQKWRTEIIHLSELTADQQDASASLCDSSDEELVKVQTFFDRHYAEKVKITPTPQVVECSSDTDSFHCNSFNASVSSLTRLSAEYKVVYHGETNLLEVRLLREEYIPTAKEYPFESRDYCSMTLWAPSDSAFIDSQLTPIPTKEKPERVLLPVQLCWKRGMLDLSSPRRNPFVMHVYGSYGDSQDEEFSALRLSILDRGFVWCSAAVRGGGEFGIPWRDAGRLMQRPTSVNDFVSVCAFLQNYPASFRHQGEGFCAPNRLISVGGSAGGMIVFRAMNMAPFLFRAVNGQVPFVDCLTSLLDDELPLTSSDWEEYGNPVESKEVYDCIKSIPHWILCPRSGLRSRVPRAGDHIFLLKVPLTIPAWGIGSR
ncbi:prolyl oligopeptidase [Angomonas deanei]|nr:prolyl oligopeptidase [Angomonas deanei]|eukprot:EPY30771.1 prolyl oligopeptidase [Angomonas deanei]